MTLYVDSSALLKGYVDEADSAVADEALVADDQLVTARHAVVEVRRNLARLLSGRSLATATSVFAADLGVFSIVELDAVTCDMPPPPPPRRRARGPSPSFISPRPSESVAPRRRS